MKISTFESQDIFLAKMKYKSFHGTYFPFFLIEDDNMDTKLMQVQAGQHLIVTS
jgi:hypothetical protein